MKTKNKTKNVYIIAGPNGAGKTTFANKFLPDYARCPNFVNADMIAQGLAPFSSQTAAMKAGRLVLEQIENFKSKGLDFAFETTLSGKSYAALLKNLKENNYHLHLFFLWIPSPDLALARIKDRVADGGHDVPEADVKRRFYRGIKNLFTIYRPLLNLWILFDNSREIPKLIAKEINGQLEVKDQLSFDTIQKMVR